jgi:hypothetical protein
MTTAATRMRYLTGALATALMLATSCNGDAVTSTAISPQPVSTTVIQPPTSPPDPEMPTASPDPVPLEPGTYDIAASAWTVADLEITLPTDWTVQYGHVFHKHSDTPQEIGFYPIVIDSIYADACQGDEGSLIRVEAGVDDLAEALLQQPGAVATGPVATTIGGQPASRIDIEVPPGADLATCSLGGHGLQIWFSAPADKYFVLLPDGRARIYIVDVHGRRQVFLIQYRAETPKADIDELDAILASIVITPGQAHP